MRALVSSVRVLTGHSCSLDDARRQPPFWGHSGAIGLLVASLFLAACGGIVPPPDKPDPAWCLAQICGESGATATVEGEYCVCACDATGATDTLQFAWPLDEHELAFARSGWASICPTAH